MKNFPLTKIGRKRGKKNNENAKQSNFLCINNYPQYKWIEFTNQKTQNTYIDKKHQLYAAYKRLTSALRTHTDLK